MKYHSKKNKVNQQISILSSPDNCPGKEAAVVIIVVSLPYTSYQCGSLIS